MNSLPARAVPASGALRLLHHSIQSHSISLKFSEMSWLNYIPFIHVAHSGTSYRAPSFTMFIHPSSFRTVFIRLHSFHSSSFNHSSGTPFVILPHRASFIPLVALHFVFHSVHSIQPRSVSFQYLHLVFIRPIIRPSLRHSLYSFHSVNELPAFGLYYNSTFAC